LRGGKIRAMVVTSCLFLVAAWPRHSPDAGRGIFLAGRRPPRLIRPAYGLTSAIFIIPHGAPERYEWFVALVVLVGLYFAIRNFKRAHPRHRRRST
jgi:hypothetical protein